MNHVKIQVKNVTDGDMGSIRAVILVVFNLADQGFYFNHMRVWDYSPHNNNK